MSMYIWGVKKVHVLNHFLTREREVILPRGCIFVLFSPGLRAFRYLLCIQYRNNKKCSLEGLLEDHFYGRDVPFGLRYLRRDSQ